ncbi:serine hydrolase [Heliophilum fasciatum]|uniref:CubicO group peptidase (Beta-lactamase class C family) n=1 Tax=Heliophilum fasciatum TaxID=35700 RepID=A0A4R2RCS0_9FIRM|nr:serine hydrolase [Heliophilum fasciatum]MCW2279125.1 CubicO group peptidase (beta-lactamase class C family) [Heliophilum fasciatum]TCP61210.1 CubicO group peptidase (beta-lactamase class C family) [Heliophilum fasciatum]
MGNWKKWGQRLIAASVAALVLVSGMGPAMARPAPPPAPQQLTPAFRTELALKPIFQQVQSNNAPGSMLLMKSPAGEHFWTSGYNNIQAQTPMPMQRDEHFRIGSVTKTFVAAMVLKLDDDSTVDLDVYRPINTYLGDNVVPNADKITVAQLLNHTSGLPDYSLSPGFLTQAQTDPMHQWKPQELVELVKSEELLSPPGTAFHYSSTNYILLGMLIQKITGEESLAKTIKTYLLEPLGLNETYLAEDIFFDLGTMAPLKEPYIHGFMQIPPFPDLVDFTAYSPSGAWAAGGMVSTVDDLAKWFRLLLKPGEVLSEAAYTKMVSNPVPAPMFGPTTQFGLGIGIIPTPVGPFFGHFGDVPGYSTTVGYLPGQDLVIVSLLNQLNPNSVITQMAFLSVALELAMMPPLWLENLTVDNLQFESMIPGGPLGFSPFAFNYIVGFEPGTSSANVLAKLPIPGMGGILVDNQPAINDQNFGVPLNAKGQTIEVKTTYGPTYSMPLVYRLHLLPNDGQAPDFKPTVKTVTTKEAQIDLEANKMGKVFWVVLPKDAPAPTVDQIKAGTDTNGDALKPNYKGNQSFYGTPPYTIKLQGLDPAAVYDVYIAGEDYINRQHQREAQRVRIIVPQPLDNVTFTDPKNEFPLAVAVMGQPPSGPIRTGEGKLLTYNELRGAGRVTDPQPWPMNFRVDTSLSSEPVQVTFPAGMQIEAPQDWNGQVYLPVIRSNPNRNAQVIIEVGAGDTPLLFSKAVRILLPGQAGRSVGFMQNNRLHPITKVLRTDTQVEADRLAYGSEGRIDVGNDLVIWTKHMTKFVVYTQSSDGGGSGDRLGYSTSGSQAATTSLVATPATTPTTSTTANTTQEQTKPVVTEKTVTMSDISDHWAKVAIERAVERGIVQGYPDGTFGPDQQVTRNQATVLLAKALGLTPSSAAPAFVDEEQIPAWSRPYVATAVAEKLIGGYEDNTFRGEQTITRAEIAVLIARALGLQSDKELLGYDDAEQVPAWAKSFVVALTEAKLLNGRENNRFAPNDAVTRAEAAVLALKLADMKEAGK